MSDRDSEFGAFLTGFVVGGLVGAAVALLFAPQSGEETRAIIKEKSIELKDKAVETVEEAYARAEAAAQEAKARADELARVAQERAEELKKRGQVVLEEQKAKIEGAIEAGKKATRRKKAEPKTDEPSEAPSKS